MKDYLILKPSIIAICYSMDKFFKYEETIVYGLIGNSIP